MSIETIIALLAALGAGGILGAVLNRRFEQQKQTNEHDIKIFNQSDEILSEQKLSDIAHFHLLGGHEIINDDFHKLTAWFEFFRKTGNQYLNKRLAKENQKLWDHIDSLTDFIATNFFTLEGQNPSNKSQYLKPDWNLDRGNPSPEEATMYHEYANELKNLTRKVLKQYSEYRLTVKRILKI